MSIEANLQVGKEEFLPLADEVFASKPIATFCTSALALYCYIRSQRASDTRIEIEDHDLMGWFAAIDSHMTLDLCLLSDVLWGFWDYSDTEYIRYMEETSAYLKRIENPEHSAIKLLSEQEFLDTCAKDKETWTEPIRLRQTVNDLIRVFDEIHPAERWWYHEEITPVHFRALSKTLSLAAELGYSKARLLCE